MEDWGSADYVSSVPNCAGEGQKTPRGEALREVIPPNGRSDRIPAKSGWCDEIEAEDTVLDNALEWAS